MSDNFTLGDRVRLLVVVAYECGDGGCQWEYDAGEIGTVIRAWPDGDDYEIAIDEYEHATVMVQREWIELVERGDGER